MASFIEKSDIVAWVQIQLEDFKEADLPDIFLDMATTKVIGELVKRRVKNLPTVDDEFHFLKFGTMCFCLDLLCKSRKITQTSGDLLRDRFGDIIHDYQRANPLFFFAQGTSESFMALLPYETFRMYGYAYCDAYVKRAFYERTGYTAPEIKITYDKTSRGWGWEIDDDIVNEADNESYSEM
ncbi:MAG: hypothetical protein ACTSUC_01735 [Promethearchaeota archaeon]